MLKLKLQRAFKIELINQTKSHKMNLNEVNQFDTGPNLETFFHMHAMFFSYKKVFDKLPAEM